MTSLALVSGEGMIYSPLGQVEPAGGRTVESHATFFNVVQCITDRAEMREQFHMQIHDNSTLCNQNWSFETL